MSPRLKMWAQKLLARFGLEIHRRTPSAPSRRFLEQYGVDTIFDVGANIGQSALHYRAIGFEHKIVSFEPVAHLFAQLRAQAAHDPLWEVENVALGATPGRAEINVSGGHAGASSILSMTDNVRVNAPDQLVVATQMIAVDTLDSALQRHYPHGDRCFVKVDVQGYERDVLEGGRSQLHRVVGMKIEMPLVENYSGETLLPTLLPHRYGLGYGAVLIEAGWSHPHTGELFQTDVMLFRTDRLSAPHASRT